MMRSCYFPLLLAAVVGLGACAAPGVQSVSSRLPGPVGGAVQAAATATTVASSVETMRFVTDRSPVPMRGTYRVRLTVGADATSFYLRTAPMSGMPIVEADRLGRQHLQGYGVMAFVAASLDGFAAAAQIGELRNEEEAEAEARRLGLGGGALWLMGPVDKTVTEGSWRTIVSISLPEGSNDVYDRHRPLLTAFQLGQNQGGADMFTADSGELVLTDGGARFVQTIRGQASETLFTLEGERISLEALDYGD